MIFVLMVIGGLALWFLGLWGIPVLAVLLIIGAWLVIRAVNVGWPANVSDKIIARHTKGIGHLDPPISPGFGLSSVENSLRAWLIEHPGEHLHLPNDRIIHGAEQGSAHHHDKDGSS